MVSSNLVKLGVFFGSRFTGQTIHAEKLFLTLYG